MHCALFGPIKGTAADYSEWEEKEESDFMIDFYETGLGSLFELS